MQNKAYTESLRRPLRQVQKLGLLLLPLLALIPLLLPATLLDRDLRADGSNNSGQGSSNSGRSMKAPKNSGGFVINLPNSAGSTQRLLFTIGFKGETLAKTLTRHLSGHLLYTSTSKGTEVINPTQDRSGKLASYGSDGKATVQLLLPSKDFLLGGLVAVETTQKAGSGSKKGPRIPTTVYFTISSDSLLLDVPAVIAAARSANITDFTLKFYDLHGKEKVRLDLFVDVAGDSVLLIF